MLSRVVEIILFCIVIRDYFRKFQHQWFQAAMRLQDRDLFPHDPCGVECGRLSSMIYFFDHSSLKLFWLLEFGCRVSTTFTYSTPLAYETHFIVSNRVITVISSHPNNQIIRTRYGPNRFRLCSPNCNSKICMRGMGMQ